ncbi:hypothetical protein Bca52824_033220 [Brassica carinata]|uniref:Uncharacterized protein n=1 Tax=Brassica carinata TaxID=52824 RepID=A0A8X7SIE0_BRACI|nr:hypothetical protein Bca52824_033220 [Brassica carinata]
MIVAAFPLPAVMDGSLGQTQTPTYISLHLSHLVRDQDRNLLELRQKEWFQIFMRTPPLARRDRSFTVSRRRYIFNLDRHCFTRSQIPLVYGIGTKFLVLHQSASVFDLQLRTERAVSAGKIFNFKWFSTPQLQNQRSYLAIFNLVQQQESFLIRSDGETDGKIDMVLLVDHVLGFEGRSCSSDGGYATSLFLGGTQRVKKGGVLMWIDMVLLVRSRHLLQSSIFAHLLNMFKHLLKEDFIYELSGFYVTRNINHFKLRDSPVAIRFINNTKFVELTMGPPPILLELFSNYFTYHGSAYVRLDAYFSVPALMVNLATTHTSITCGAVPMNQTAPPTETTTTAEVTVSDSSAMERHFAAAEMELKKPHNT